MFGRPAPSFRCPDCGDREFAIDHIEKDHKIHMAKAKARLETIECATYRCASCGKTNSAEIPKGRQGCFGRTVCTPPQRKAMTLTCRTTKTKPSTAV